MNRSEANTDTMLRKAQSSLISMTRTVSTVIMASVIFLVGIFIGRATVPALFEKDRTELVLSRIAQEVNARKEMLDHLRLQTPTPKVNYPAELQKDDPQAFVPQEKQATAPSPASTSGSAIDAATKPKAEQAAAPAPKSATAEAAPIEKSVQSNRPEPPVAASAPVPQAKPPKTVEPPRSAAPPATQAPVPKPAEMAPPATIPPAVKTAGTASIKALVYSRKAADEMAASFRMKGLAPSVQPRMTKTGVRYEVTVSNVGSAADASALAGSIRQSHPGSEVVIGR
ncbi:SPOR domain-containing protein [Desulfatirhabdium butyrativorans]|uniref:SPOR domain-containing protein n=1 Tax=Desulfatirhabdium butyrativorans TaxID=340467 RepID=UPI0004117731|nr:SPOR domain-containing protein [Desulfatirhabdium butyrativorans]